MNSTAPPPEIHLRLIQALRESLGDSAVSTDDAHLNLLAHDVYGRGAPALAALRPGNVAALRSAVRLCAAARVAMVPRGGGASYTDGYLLATGGHVLVDTGALQHIEVDTDNAQVTVGAGVTWAALRERLAPLGLRTPFWGPFSGLVATVGGSVSQNSISHGSASHGITAQSVLSVDVVLASGELLRTGLSPATRHFGPDLTGLFTGDCGALGIKAAICLPLIAARSDFEALSFAFGNFASFHAALRSAAREGLEDESFGLDRALSQGQIGKQSSLAARLGIARQVLAAAPGVGAGLRQLLRMALAGEKVLGLGEYMAHFIVEGCDADDARAKARRLRRLMAASAGREIANTVPGFVRALPFAPLSNILGPRGERWVPLHGIVPHAAVAACHAELQALWDAHRDEMQHLGVWHGTMFCTVGSSGLLYEIALYWPDICTPYHEATLPPEHWQQIRRYPADPQAAALVARLKHELIALFARHEAAHFQIGRAYPYATRLSAPALNLLEALKQALDPHHLMNPGALGLSADAPHAVAAAVIEPLRPAA
ncbi:FAD-binding oxidoreductase [Aquabacterium sp. OR-4]|uniref:FAD-binding oxidoreductase n=1 Tax=Aquabacterium sp. OR-4 TaxID=2978127 RepID=UPI0021B3599D|nr:FAD-binding oxidoreductase [Aquabacterium sp. OR-4]MDT7836939.1 FAD-binding oxidoreductase [Aquabacterium sp. OR-4]